MPEPRPVGPGRGPDRAEPRTPGTASIDDPASALYTVGQVAAMLGVQQAFLRRLDTEEVVQPARSPGGQRRYSRQEIVQVERVATLMGEGMTLASIRRIVALEAEVAELRAEVARLRARTRR